MSLSHEPIRVMRVITRLNVGGPSFQAIYLSERLQDKEFHSELCVGSVGKTEGNMEWLAEERRVPLTRIGGLGREISLRTDGLTVRRIYKEIRRFRPEILHTHLAKAGAVGRLAGKLARVPKMVHTYHGHVFTGYFSQRKTRAFLRIEKTLARWTDRIVVLSDGQRDEILGFGVGKRDQFTTIPLGLELTPFLSAYRFRGSLREELGMSSEAPIVGIVARLVPIKAHDLFLEAAAIVATVFPNIHFAIVGDGDLKEQLVRKARALGMTARVQGEKNEIASGPVVHFLGFRSDLPRIYADLDAAVVCSQNEGMPVAIIEALASERPVVGTDVGAMRSLIDHGRTGLLVPPSNKDALAAAIIQQIRQRDTACEMARRGRDHVYPSLSIERLERDIRGLYRELVGLPIKDGAVTASGSPS